jgi:Cu(I)/Ag(I) efflux system membrane fusion protein
MRLAPIALAALLLASGAATAVAQRQPLYYQDPSGKPDYSPTPKRDAQGRDFVPVYGDEAPQPAAAPTPPQPERRVLYYRNPMGLPDTSPVPKKDAMGMPYVPVYADETGDGAGTVTISPERVQLLGVRTEAAALKSLARPIRAVGTIAADERRLTVVSPRYEGWIQKLLVNTTGQSVQCGQVLLEMYSRDLAVVEQEYLVARHASGAIAEAALTRLRNFNVAPDELARLRRTGAVNPNPEMVSPADGVVLEKTAIEGMRFAPGDALYRIADLSQVWLLADVFEQDIAQVRPGETVKISIAAYPDRSFAGQVTYVYPTVNPTTRTTRVRIEIPNPDLSLKLEMYATVEIAAPVAAAPVLVVPDSAVLDSGTRQLVLLQRAPGRFEPRAIEIGQRADGFTEISKGLAAGDSVVVGANFLIDAESNLRAALQAFTTAPKGAPK